MNKHLLLPIVAILLIVALLLPLQTQTAQAKSASYAVQANNYYVTPTGTGTSCTSTAPCSLSSVQSKVVSGDIIHASGNFAARQTLSASNVTLTGGVFREGLDIRGNFVTVQTIEVSSTTQICLGAYGHDLILDGILAHECYDHGVNIDQTSNVTIRNSKVYRASLKNSAKTSSSGWASGIKVRLSTNVTVENNTVYNNYGEGIATRGSFVIVRGNKVYDNYSMGIYTNGDNNLIEKNFVYTTGNTEFYRNGLPMIGIGVADEYFSGWGSHSFGETIINNIVTACRYGFYYGGADSNVSGGGLRDSTIAFNTFYQTNQAGVRILYESAQKNVLVTNNITTILPDVDNPTGITLTANRAVTLTGGMDPNGYKLTTANTADRVYSVQSDFGGLRTAPLDIGAWDFGGTTVTQTPLGSATSTPTKTATVGPTKTATPTSTPISNGTILTTGKHDDSANGINYTGAWTTSTNSNAYGGSFHSSSSTSDFVSFSFTGNSFSVYFDSALNHGKIAVYVDGAQTALINQYGNTGWQKTWASPDFGYGTHTIKLTHYSGAVVTLDGILIAAGTTSTATFTSTPGSIPTATATSTSPSTGGLTDGLYDDKNSNIIYSGSWGIAASAIAYGGSLHLSKLNGNSLTFAFTGGGFALRFVANLNYGIISVYVDGTPVTTINQSSTSGASQKIWNSPAFASGNHTVQLVHSSGGTTDLDAIQVYAGAPPAP